MMTTKAGIIILGGIFIFISVGFPLFHIGAAEKKAWTSPYPDMRDFSLPAPPGHRPLENHDIVIDKNAILSRQNFNPLLGTPEKLIDEGLQRQSKNGFSHTLDFFGNWKPGRESDMHYGNTFRAMGDAAYLYFLTGNRELGNYVRAYTMHALSLDDWFWYGQAMFEHGWDKSRHASLITATINRTLVTILIFAGNAFSDTERRQIEETLRKNCHDSSMRFCATRIKSRSNVLPFIAGGLLLSSKYFQDDKGKRLALECFENFISSSIEKDGSYGEGLHYFFYTAANLLDPYLLMDQDERKQIFAQSHLRHSPVWLAYHCYFKIIHPGQKDFYKSAFGDSNFDEAMPHKMLKMFSALHNNPMIEFFENKNWESAKKQLIQLPLMKCFDNGECFIRGGWDPDAPVLGIQAHRHVLAPGHRRPESGSFTLGFAGLPIVMHAGNTNLYRRPIHEYAKKTSSANTICIDDSDQNPPRVQKNRILVEHSGKNIDILCFDLSSAYPQSSKCLRAFVFIRNIQTYVVMDHLSFHQTTHDVAAYLHLNNLRSDSSLKKIADNSWHYRNPMAEMSIHLGASQPIRSESLKGFIVSNLHSNWDEANQLKEMQRGNSFKLRYGGADIRDGACLYAVLSPVAPGGPILPVPGWDGHTLDITGTRISLDAQSLRISSAGVQMDFKL